MIGIFSSPREPEPKATLARHGAAAFRTLSSAQRFVGEDPPIALDGVNVTETWEHEPLSYAAAALPHHSCPH
jgi:hypothetical protein